MTLTRIAGLVVFASAIAGGCKKPSARTKPTGNDTGPEPVTLAVPGAATVGRSANGAEAFAGQFLKAVNDGTATPAMLTQQFKKVIAEPVFESDRAAGYSEIGAASWLAQFKGKLPGAVVGPAVVGTDPNAPGYCVLIDASPKITFPLRVVPATGGWQADWFGVSSGVAPQSVLSGGPAGFSAIAFLGAVAAKDDRLAEVLMTPVLKARLAPPFDSDKARGYNRGILSGKLSDLRGSATGFTLDRVDGSAVTATFAAGGAKKSVTLKFIKGERPWDWLVDDIQTK
jgi:hypothetical protein